MVHVLDRRIDTPLGEWSVTKAAQRGTPTARYDDCIYLYGVPVPQVTMPFRGICGQLSDEGFTCDRPLGHTCRCRATLMVNNRLYAVAVWPA